MTKPKFSPGPWYWDDEGFLLDAEGNLLIEGCDELDGDDPSLVAASRCLYNSLSEILDYRGGAANALEDEYVEDRAKAALAKARGET
jgi:hypothetical protein